MNYSFDLTGASFNRIDLEQSILAFEMPDELPDKFSILVWGAYVAQPEPELWELVSVNMELSDPCPIYLSDWAVLSWENVVGGRLDTVHYEPDLNPRKPSKSRKNSDGSVFELTREWPKKHSEPTAIEYSLACFLEYPDAFISFDIFATGGVRLDANPDKFVPASVVLQELDKYCYDRYRKRQLAALLKNAT